MAQDLQVLETVSNILGFFVRNVAKETALLGGSAQILNRPTSDIVYSSISGSALQSFIAPFNFNIRAMRSKSSTRAMISLNGRTAFDSNALSGAGGGYIGSVGLNQPWDGNFPIQVGQQVWVNVPIGNETEFTIERLPD